MTPREAVREAYKQYPVMAAMSRELKGELCAEARRGGASLSDKALREAMGKAWADDGLTLSQRTTRGSKWVVQQVTQTIETAVKKGGSVMSMAKDLFDGYGHGGTIPEQELPEFMSKLTKLTRDYNSKPFKQALRKAERSIGRLQTKGLQAAYNGVLDALATENDEKIAKAIDVAVQEKTRYFAERIARTEKARAYADGIMYKYASDPDCIAFKWKLSSRHPCDDICDLYARADLWGMGAGIFPKDKVPTLPVHPNCMCRLIPVYSGSKRVTSETPRNRILDGGMEYLKSIGSVAGANLLGENGAQKVKQGGDWRSYARGYSDEQMTSRICRDIIKVERPEGEQEELKGFRFVGAEKTKEAGLEAVNPRYHEAKKWRENCQRCVVAEELRNRGYDVTAKPFANDDIGDDSLACWEFDSGKSQKDAGFALVGRKTGFKREIKAAFLRWGKTARAIVRVQWGQQNGGYGHVFSCHYENGEIIYTDPQIGERLDIDDTLAKCTSIPWQIWIMRVDNRKLTKLVKKAVFNVKKEGS